MCLTYYIAHGEGRKEGRKSLPLKRIQRALFSLTSPSLAIRDRRTGTPTMSSAVRSMLGTTTSVFFQRQRTNCAPKVPRVSVAFLFPTVIRRTNALSQAPVPLPHRHHRDEVVRTIQDSHLRGATTTTIEKRALTVISSKLHRRRNRTNWKDRDCRKRWQH